MRYSPLRFVLYILLGPLIFWASHQGLGALCSSGGSTEQGGGLVGRVLFTHLLFGVPFIVVAVYVWVRWPDRAFMKLPLWGEVLVVASSLAVGAAGGLLAAYAPADSWLPVFLSAGGVAALSCIIVPRFLAAHGEQSRLHGNPGVRWTILAVPIALATLTHVTEAGFACQSPDTWPVLSILSLAYVPIGAVVSGWVAAALPPKSRSRSGR
jgi:hypothetical protein